MNYSSPSKRSPLKFFILTFVLATPIWLLGTLFKVEGLPLDIPWTDLVLAFMPLTAAAILVYKDEGSGGASNLLKRVFDYRRIKRKVWFVPIVLLLPFLNLVMYSVMLLLDLPLPTNPGNQFLMIPLVFILFFVLAVGEEIGWTGYATDPLQERWNALTAAIIIGLVSMIGHYPSIMEQGRDLTFIAWSTIGIGVGWRILAVWIYNNTGKSVFAVILFHAIGNVCRFAFPSDQNHNPLVDYLGVHYSIFLIAGIIVTFLWGWETLAQYRYSRSTPNVESIIA